MLADTRESDGLKIIDLSAGHASSGETLCGRIILALKSQALLNESVGSGYIDRNWPPALKESGAWPLPSLRQSFLNGALTRLLDPDTILRNKIVEFVGWGEFGLASGQKPDGTYTRVWFSEPVPPDEISFEAGVFLLNKARAKGLKVTPVTPCIVTPGEPGPAPVVVEPPYSSGVPEEGGDRTEVGIPIGTKTFHLRGTIPSEIWNRVGTKSMEADLRQVLEDLGLRDSIKIEK